MRKLLNRVVLSIGLLLMFFGAAFYYYESNPWIYNTVAGAGIDINVLDSLGLWEGELSGGKYYTLENEKGEEIDQTAHEVFIGDELILEDNNRYKVVSVDSENLKAKCELVGRETIEWRDEWEQASVLQVATAQKTVGIYMTHNDESYQPTDGTESKPGRGGIVDVGYTFAQALKNKGMEAQVSDNAHDPHDANAYHRSRKTAVQLLRNNPAALFDIHRDGIPDPGFYEATINGENLTKLRLVVGRQNPHMSSNLEFAKQIKAYFDKVQPGLIKGIFMAKGNYNQDLAPRILIVEAGTYTNHQEQAEKGITLFADGIPKILGVTAPGGGGGPAEVPTSPGASRALLWLLALVIIGGGAFLLVSTGSLQGSLERLSGLGREFSNYLGPLKKRKKNRE